MLDIEKLIESNLEYSQGRLKGQGERTGKYNNALLPWNADGDFSNVINEKDDFFEYLFEESHWLYALEYYKETGFLFISFNPITTNGKPPIVLGLNGKPITPAFVGAFIQGIYSEHYGYDNSSGAFYVRYIQQYIWVNSIQDYVLNDKRVVEAVEITDILASKKQIDKMREKAERKKTRENIMKQKIADQLMTPIQKFRMYLVNPEKLKEHAEDYIMGKIKKFAKEKLLLNDPDPGPRQYIKEQILTKMDTNMLWKQVKGIDKASGVIQKSINKKGFGGLTRKVTRQAIKGNASRALASETASGEAIALAPETAGLSLLIAAGIGVTKSMKRNQSVMTQVAGREGLSILEIQAFKMVTRDEIKKQLKREFIDNGFENMKETTKDIKKQVKSNFMENIKIDTQVSASKEAYDNWANINKSSFYRPGSKSAYKSADAAYKKSKK